MQQQKSRAFYRIQATRMMIGAGNILKKHAADQARKVRRASVIDSNSPPMALTWPVYLCPVLFSFQVVSSHETQAQEDDPYTIRMEFEPSLYQCFENCGSLKLTVSRHGGDSGVTVKVCAPVWLFRWIVCVHKSVRESSQKTRRQKQRSKKALNWFHSHLWQISCSWSGLPHNLL